MPKKNERIAVLLSPVERERLAELARENRRSMSGMVRELLLPALERKAA